MAPPPADNARAPVSAPRGEILPLTASRFLIGVSLYVLHTVHFQLLSQPALARETGWRWAGDFGSGAVAFFFLLSGFTLTYCYARRFRSPSRHGVLRFYTARIASIWPVHLLAVVLALPFFLKAMSAAPARWSAIGAAHVSLTQSLVPFTTGPNSPDWMTLAYNTPSWSLSCLVCFYLVFPLIVWLAAERFRPSNVTLIALCCAAWTLESALAYSFRASHYAAWLFHYTPYLRFTDFFCGVLLGLVFLRQREHATAPVDRDVEATAAGRTSTATSPSQRVRWTMLEATAVGAWFGLWLLHPLVPATMQYSAWYLPAMAMIVYVFAHARGSLSDALSHRWLVYLGRISLPFLMLHFMLMAYAQKFGVYGLSWPLANLIVLPLVLGVSVAAHHWYEVPMRVRVRAAGDGWLAARAPHPQGVVPLSAAARVQAAADAMTIASPQPDIANVDEQEPDVDAHEPDVDEPRVA